MFKKSEICVQRKVQKVFRTPSLRILCFLRVRTACDAFALFIEDALRMI